MTVGTVGAWNKKVGDAVKPGDTIAEIQTDKASMAFESQEEFVIAKLLVPAGSEVAVGAPILITVEDESSVAAFANYDLAAATAGATAPSGAADSAAPVPAAVTKSIPTGPQLFMPAARHLIESKHLNTDKMRGTSKGGRINKADVLLAMKAGLAVPGAAPAHVTATVTAPAGAATAPIAQTTVAPVKAAAGPAPTVVVPMKLEDPTGGVPINSRYTDIPNTNMRKIIAKRLTESKATVPHYYVTMECEIDELLELRKQFKKDFDVNVSVNDFVIRASALALRDVPTVNCKWDTKTNSVVPPGPVDISIAVATPAGLITPIVPATDKRGLENISEKVKDLAKRAKDNKLKPEEFQGGSFTISNLGERRAF
jgi:pyruvate dehydrogenase E2 component (dihydrolipoamide acetyltransferase)